MQRRLLRRGDIVRRITPAKYAIETYNTKTLHTDRLRRGEYDTAAEAVTAARALIDEQLLATIGTGRFWEDAYRDWMSFGEVPSIVAIATEAHEVDFDAFSYAASQAQAMAEVERIARSHRKN
jgi:hypothetical protein